MDIPTLSLFNPIDSVYSWGPYLLSTVSYVRVCMHLHVCVRACAHVSVSVLVGWGRVAESTGIA